MTDRLDWLETARADRYKIERELGAGGMATVYLAEDLKHKRKVAVKVLRPTSVSGRTHIGLLGYTLAILHYHIAAPSGKTVAKNHGW